VRVFVLAHVLHPAQSAGGLSHRRVSTPERGTQYSLSVVLRLEDDSGNVAILTGDATWNNENQMLEGYPRSFLRANILRLGHHGSRVTSTQAAWAQAVAPDVVFASAGAVRRWGHPTCVVIDSALDAGEVDGGRFPHRIQCGFHDNATMDGIRCDEKSGPWCQATTRQAIYTTYTNGYLRIESSGYVWVEKP